MIDAGQNYDSVVALNPVQILWLYTRRGKIECSSLEEAQALRAMSTLIR